MRLILAFVMMLICLPANANEPHSIQNIHVNSGTLNKIHRSVLSRFTGEESNPPDETFMYYTSYDEVRGDCDDFASAVYFELWKRDYNPKVYVYDSRGTPSQEPYRHVVVCALDSCFDNNKERTISRKKFERALEGVAFKLVLSGEFDESKMNELLAYEREIMTTGGYSSD